MERDPDWTSEDRRAAFWMLDRFSGGHVWVGWFEGASPWERHPAGDELVHVLEGEVDVTVLTDEGPVTTTLTAGTGCVVPQGAWHRQAARGRVVEYGATPGVTEHSGAEDPREED